MIQMILLRGLMAVKAVHPDGLMNQPVLPEGEDLYLYPNPTEDVINIVFGNSLNSSNGTEIQLFDAGGKLLVKKTAEAIESVVGVELDVSLFRHGVYFVRIIQSDKVLTKPFVKI